MNSSAATPRPRSLAPLFLPLALPIACMAWAYWGTFVDLTLVWNGNPQYSHGFLVPVFAGFLLWFRRDKLDTSALRPSVVGLLFLALGLGIKLVGALGYYVSLDAISLLPCAAGLVWLSGGRAAWRWAWPAVCFLAFMIPLPYFASVAMSGQLQWLATISSTFIMQCLGLPALAEGNVILLNDHEIGIVEACSGLRMLVVFFALAAAVVLVSQRHWLDRLLLLASAVPIALISNILRVTATGVMYELGYSELASHFFHDVAGWLMMPLALGMLWIELQILSRLFIDSPMPIPTRTPLTARRALPRTAVPRPRRQPAASQPTRERPRPVVEEQPVEQRP